MNIVILAAGKSSRFPNMKPKYLLTAYDHKLMIQHAVECFDPNSQIHIAVLKEHCEQYQADLILSEAIGSRLTLTIIDHPTNGPVETASMVIQANNLKGPLFIKDCDTFIKLAKPLEPINGVVVAKLHDYPNIRNVGAKSYVKSNDQGIIQSIVEKQIISNLFSVGGYQFEDTDQFEQVAKKLIYKQSSEVYISNLIDLMISEGTLFETIDCEDFIDVGTAEDWIKYNRQHPVLFVDIDGVLVKNQSHYGTNKFDKAATILEDNVKLLLLKQQQGAQFIFTTARPSKFDKFTNDLLVSLGFKNYRLLSDLYATNRILINDFDYSNPYPSADAINIKRNSNDLEYYLNNIK